MLGIAFISCSDSDKSVNQNISGQSYSFGVSYVNVWNPTNPYDSIGFIHNELLDYAISQYGGSSGAATFPDNLSNLISNRCYSNYSTTISADTLEASKDDFYDELMEAAGDSLSFYEFLEGRFSTTIADELVTIFNIVNDCTSQNMLTSTIAQLKLNENSVSLSTVLTQQEKNVILAASAQAKFSLVYWTDATLNVDSEWTDWGEDYDSNFEQPYFIDITGAALADAIKIAIEITEGNDDFVDIAAKSAVTSGLAYIAATAEATCSVIGAVIGFIVSLFS